jgi:hypothetical protein
MAVVFGPGSSNGINNGSKETTRASSLDFEQCIQQRHAGRERPG